MVCSSLGDGSGRIDSRRRGSLLLLLSSSISPETERLRSLRVLQKQVARPQEAVGQRLRIILSWEKGDRVGLAGNGLGAWAGLGGSLFIRRKID